MERECKHAVFNENTKSLIKQVQKEDALNDLLESVTDLEDNLKRKPPLPTPLRKKLKLNLNNLPTPKDDEYITFTETVSESS